MGSDIILVRRDLLAFWLMGDTPSSNPPSRGNLEQCTSCSSEVNPETFYLYLATLIFKNYEIIQKCAKNKRLHKKELFSV